MNYVVSSGDDGTVKLWDLNTGDFIRNLVLLESAGSGGKILYHRFHMFGIFQSRDESFALFILIFYKYVEI